jgi:hypothetical protein
VSISLGRFTSTDTIIPQQQGVQAWDRYAYTNNNPIRYNDPTGHMCSDPEDPTPSCDQNFHAANENIHWDSRTQPKGLTKDQREAAEAAYLHALDDPQYFYDLFFNSDLSVWENNAEVRSLDIYLQYSTLHTSADKFILGQFGLDQTSGSIARAINSDDPRAATDFVEGLAAITLAGYGSSVKDGQWTTPRNAAEQEAMDYAMKNYSTGTPLKLTLNRGSWTTEEGWMKMERIYNGVKIHYVWNPILQMYDDFKFVGYDR